MIKLSRNKFAKPGKAKPSAEKTISAWRSYASDSQSKVSSAQLKAELATPRWIVNDKKT
jgi:hypothetical protein